MACSHNRSGTRSKAPQCRWRQQLAARWPGVRKVNHDDQLTIQAALAGAGLGVAFNAPLAGPIFVVEELTKTIQFRVIVFTSGNWCRRRCLRFLMGGAPISWSRTGLCRFLLSPCSFCSGYLFGLLDAAYSKRRRSTSWTCFNGPRQFRSSCERRSLVVPLGLLGWFLPDSRRGPGQPDPRTSRVDAPLLWSLPIWSSGGSSARISYLLGTPGGSSHRCLLSGSDWSCELAWTAQPDFAVDLGNPIIYVLLMSALCRGRSSAQSPGSHWWLR